MLQNFNRLTESVTFFLYKKKSLSAAFLRINHRRIPFYVTGSSQRPLASLKIYLYHLLIQTRELNYKLFYTWPYLIKYR